MVFISFEDSSSSTWTKKGVGYIGVTIIPCAHIVECINVHFKSTRRNQENHMNLQMPIHLCLTMKQDEYDCWMRLKATTSSEDTEG